MKKILFFLIFALTKLCFAQDKVEGKDLPPFPAPTGLKVQLIVVDEPKEEKKQFKADKKYIEVSYQGLTNFYFTREDLNTAKNKLTSSGRYVWSEVIKIQKTWEDSKEGHYFLARVLFGNTNFGGQTYGIQGGFGWSGKYYQAGAFLGLQHRGEQYYLNEFKYNPKKPPPPPEPGEKTNFSFSSPLPENPIFGAELNFRIPITKRSNLKINNAILPGITTHGLGFEYLY